MNALLNLWNAVANLARSLNRLAAVADSVSEQVEQRVEVIGYNGKQPAIIVEEEAPANGRKRVVAK